MVTAIYILALGTIAYVVYHGLLKKKNMWAWIVLYWGILFFKNLIDILSD